MTKLVADVMDAQLIDNTTGDVITSLTLQSANIEVTVATNDVRGGKGNQLLATLHSDRDINVTLSDAEFNFDWLTKQFGVAAVAGATTAWAVPKTYTAATTTGVTITLSPAPLASGSGLKTYLLTTGVEVTGTISGATVTFASGVSAGDVVDVRAYKYTTGATSKTVTIDNTKFAKGATLILTTAEINQDEAEQALIQFEFPNAIFSGSFNVNTTAERTASAQEFSLRIVKPTGSTNVGTMKRVIQP